MSATVLKGLRCRLHPPAILKIGGHVHQEAECYESRLLRRQERPIGCDRPPRVQGMKVDPTSIGDEYIWVGKEVIKVHQHRRQKDEPRERPFPTKEEPGN